MTFYDKPDRPGLWQGPQGQAVQVSQGMIDDKSGALTWALGGWQPLETTYAVVTRANTRLRLVLAQELNAGNISADVHDRLYEALHPLEVPRARE
ncbi:hypothetical protein M2390_002598 [Mycetocola sp. BIGb0189]|uniref:hypothetical protein n=1 Tax=Mycetocola sp. BIGb0189 TaxID=2940604 RepID=UPI0021683ADE|nr:hypothetical protein [Mycetocola sp. BIGb0189]MCS4277392.1 hypothetical protein [Mycetocola sp. BIGb0189]